MQCFVRGLMGDVEMCGGCCCVSLPQGVRQFSAGINEKLKSDGSTEALMSLSCHAETLVCILATFCLCFESFLLQKTAWLLIRCTAVAFVCARKVRILM